jgi:AcrR family transcriptional regulator
VATKAPIGRHAASSDLRGAKAKLLDAAIALFSHNGYADTTVDEIVAAAGVQKGTFYYHFPSKEMVLTTIFEHVIERSLEINAKLLTPTDDPLASLADHIRNMVHFIGSSRPEVMIFHEQRRVMLKDKRLAAHREEAERRLVSFIQSGQELGKIRADHDAKIVALSIIGTWTWLYHWYREGRQSLDAIADTQAAIIIDGLRPRP